MNWNVKRRIAAVFSVAAIATGVMTVTGGGPAAAAGEACWQWSKSNPYKSVGMTLWKGNYTVKWCGQNGRVTKFWVLRCDVSDAKPIFVRVPARSSDCQPRTGNGGSTLPIYGDMWVDPTVSYKNKIGWNPGQLRMHYEIVLHPNGVITGDVK
nr:hypothetical protein Ade03nite_29790 [Actinoplanes derwentensis]